ATRRGPPAPSGGAATQWWRFVRPGPRQDAKPAFDHTSTPKLEPHTSGCWGTASVPWLTAGSPALIARSAGPSQVMGSTGSGLPRRPRQGRGAKSVSATGGGVSPPSRAKDICTSARSHDGTSAASRRPSDDLGRSGQAGGASLGGSGGGSAGALGACSPSG